MNNAPLTPVPHAPKKHPLQDNFYERHQVDIRMVRNLGNCLGLRPSLHFMFLAELCVVINMKY